MTTHTIPQVEGEVATEEMRAWNEALINQENLAGQQDKTERSQKLVQSVVREWEEKMHGLRRRWRAVYYMLSGNTLEKGGTEDVHVPEIYKAAETIVPRIEEQILDRQPWFRIVPRRETSREKAQANEAYIDWQFSQAKVRDLIQPAIRDALFTQSAIFYVSWDVVEKMCAERTITREITKQGLLKRSVKVEKKKKVTFCGPRVTLVDPFDFIIDTKARDPQNATFVGHRVYMTIDQVRELGKQRGWVNIDKINDKKPYSTITATNDYYSYPRDPASRYKTRHDETEPQIDGRPSKIEVVFLYTKASFDDGETYDDYLIVMAGGNTVVEVRVNPLDGQYRPYAVIRSSKSGHEFYSTGVFDNAVRLNQHADAFHQLFLAGAKLTSAPMVFAEEDSDLPDTLYKIRPGQVLKGVGPVRMTQMPDGFLRSAPLVMGMLQKNIEETVGAFRINMGQDVGGTATEATLSLQEGNRRNRGLIRAVADGLEQLLHIFHKMNLQFSTEDVEFPVLGKRALAIRKTTMNIGPADLLDDVEFELIGLHNARNYGLRATGFQALLNTGMPLLQANPQNVNMLAMLHDMVSELLGPDDADRYIKIPTPVEELRSQTEENEGLLNGTEIEVDPDDDHAQHKRELKPLWQRAIDPANDMPFYVRRAIAKHWLEHDQLDQRQRAQDAVTQRRQEANPLQAMQAGGIASPETGMASPVAGGQVAARTPQSQPEDFASGSPGQTQGETPGPPDTRKAYRSGRSRQTLPQSQNGALGGM